MVVLGRIVAPYGVKGWVHIHPFADDPASWGSLPSWWLAADAESEAAAWRAVELERTRMHSAGLVAKFSDIGDRQSAEALTGLFVGAPREALPVPAADEYYWSDLIGLEVVNLQGQSLGCVSSLIETGANAVLVVGSGDGERLLPFVAQVVQKVDIDTKRISVDWGLDW